MEPGIYDSENNLIKSYEELVEEGLDIYRRYSLCDINYKPFSAHNLFLKYKPSKLVLPDSLKRIGKYALSYCSSLEEVVLGKSVKEICDCAFENCTNLNKITFNDNLKNICYGVFKNCSKLENIEFPSSLCSINNEIFDGCYRIKEIYLPASLTFIEEKAFHSCPNLEKIEVDPKNKDFCSEDGVLFLKDKTALVVYPICKKENTYKIPSETTIIADNAFAFNGLIKEVIFPDNLEFIGSGAFMWTNITKAYLPDSLRNLLSYSFTNCRHLKEVKLPDNVRISNGVFANTYELKEINVSKTFIKNHPKFVEEFKDKIRITKTLEELLEEGTSFKEINKKFKSNNIER